MRRLGFMSWPEFVHEFAPGENFAHGTSGVVLASCSSPHVAIKCFDQDHFSEFVREVNLMRTLRHPSVLPLLGVGVEPPPSSQISRTINTTKQASSTTSSPHSGSASSATARCFYIAMPRGRSIVEAVKQKEITILDVARQLLSVLVLMHEHHHWAHGDIKPDNVLFCEGRACMIDFGHAEKAEPYEPSGELFFGAARVYTLGFRAPEVDFSARNSIKSDMFAFGKTLLALRCGKRCFEDQDFYLAHTAEFRKTNDTVDKVIEQCCRLNVRERPSARELLQQLHGADRVLFTPRPKLSRDMFASPRDSQTEEVFNLASEFPACVAFLALHLLHLIREEKDSEIDKARGCVAVAAALHDREYELPDACVDSAFACLARLGGKVDRKTLYHYASGADHLVLLLHHALLPTYTTQQIPQAPTPTSGSKEPRDLSTLALLQRYGRWGGKLPTRQNKSQTQEPVCQWNTADLNEENVRRFEAFVRYLQQHHADAWQETFSEQLGALTRLCLPK